MTSGSESALSRREALAAAAAGLSLSACGATGRAREDPGREPAGRAEREARQAALFPELRDESASVDPIRPEERRERRERLGRLLAERGLGALLLEGGATMTYLAGVSWGRSERFFGLLAFADGSHLWVCPAFEESRARLQIDATGGPGGEVLAWQEDEYPWRPLSAELRRRGVERVALEPSLRCVFAERLAAEAGERAIARGAGPELVLALRGRKDAHEIAILRRANELTQKAIAAAALRVRPGMTGAEVGALVRSAHARLGFSSSWNLSLVGPAAALPHGDSDARRIGRGDVLLVDAGGSLHGYQSDETRTWVVEGPVPAEVDRAWNAVRDAQLRAFEAVRPGAVCGDVDRAARASITAAGFEGGYRAFTHRLGHGIGLEGHEDPYFDGGSRVVLAPGMTLSDEPGLYFPGRFGVRLEDVVLATAEGAQHFGDWQRSPTSPA